MTAWQRSWSADPQARQLADRHYNRQSIGAAKFTPPGQCLVLRTPGADAVWATSYPIATYVRHAWGGAWINSLFRNEGPLLSSDLIREAVAITTGIWPRIPEMGMVTFVDTNKTRQKRDPGRCYLRAGFQPAYCPRHAFLDLILAGCAACQGRTKKGLVALQILPADMPETIRLTTWGQVSLWEAVS